MAFIGNTNTTQAFTPAIDYFSGNASTTAFTLSRPVASVAQVQAVVNNVAQNPSDAFTVSGNTITFTSAPSSGTNNIYVYYTSPITQVIAPSQGTVGTTQLQNGLTVNFADGTATAPSITNDGDTNTGIFFPAADTIAFSEGGAEAMRIDSSGNVGIGVTPSVASVKLTTVGGPVQLSPGTTSQEGIRLTRASGICQINGINNDNNAYNALTFATGASEAMRIDTSGNVGIGTSSPAVKLHVSGGTQRIQSTGSTSNAFLTLQNDVGTQAILGIVSSGNSPANNFYIETNAGKTVYVDTGGRMLLGATGVNYNEQLKITFPNTQGIHLNESTSSSSVNYQYFTKGATPTNVGAIFYNGSVMAYQTTSDYRLKENIAPMTGALAKIAALKPVTYTWKDNQRNGEGFIAHELQEHFPDAVSGIKDDVDEDGNPKYQGMDASILISTLTAAIQEQQTLITALTARITALENK